MIFNEVYIGRIPEIEKIFNVFSDARDTYKKNKLAGIKKLSIVESHVEYFFGFEKFSLGIEPTNTINAYCYPVTTSLDSDPYLGMYTDSKGYHFSKHDKLGAICRITSGLFDNDNFTNEEVFAIFLHEIGHNFVNRSPEIDAMQDAYKSMVSTNIIMTVLKDILLGPIGLVKGWLDDDYMTIMTSTNFTKKFIISYEKALKKFPFLDITRYGYHAIKSKIVGVFNGLVSGIGHITGLNRIVARSNYNQAKAYQKTTKKDNPNAYARSLERLSDDFVSIYGFAPQLSSALVKMGNDNYSKNRKIFYIKFIEDTYNLQFEYINTLGSHPSTSDRVFKMIENLNHELNTDKTLSTKEKEMLRAQLKELNKVVTEGKALSGELAKYPDQYKAAIIQLGFKNGSTERPNEKKFTDVKSINKDFNEIHESDNIYDKFFNF